MTALSNKGARRACNKHALELVKGWPIAGRLFRAGAAECRNNRTNSRMIIGVLTCWNFQAKLLENQSFRSRGVRKCDVRQLNVAI